MSGILYVVGTPIGNLEDITLRALETLKGVDFVLAEDTRVTSKLLSNFEIKKEIISYHQHSSDSKKLEILKLLIEGKNLALVTDAGTPGISDPGNELVDFLLSTEQSIKIVPIPGVSAITTLLSSCGIKCDKFLFIGFWPKKHKTKYLELVKEAGIPIVFFESPYRILKTLELLDNEFPEKRIVVGRELTKMFETLYRGTIKEVREKISKDKLKGEIVAVLEGT